MLSNKQRIANAVKWLDELTTTDKPQGKEQLGDRYTGFCCLGVGCALFELDYRPENGSSDDFEDLVGIEVTARLVEMNDKSDHTFEEIADAVKKNPSLCFTPAVSEAIKKHYENT